MLMIFSLYKKFGFIVVVHVLGCHGNLKFPLTYTVIGKVILALISVSLLTEDIVELQWLEH